jgi:hypothetical protein
VADVVDVRDDGGDRSALAARRFGAPRRIRESFDEHAVRALVEVPGVEDGIRKRDRRGHGPPF